LTRSWHCAMSDKQEGVPLLVISRDNAEHYFWGTGCDGWHLGIPPRQIHEVAKGNSSNYHGCGKEYGASYDEIVAFTERLHREAIETLSHFTTEDLQRRCATPDGASIPVWKWLRSMVEHEIHHRSRI
jgi:uncharacterized damage-inducible protein DinB